MGPMVSGIYFTYREKGINGLKDYFRRIIDGKRLGLKGWVFSLFLAPFVTILAGYLNQFLHGEGLHGDTSILDFSSGPLNWLYSAVAFLTYFIWFGPFPEELGWRGYALDKLLGRYTPFISSLILGLFWAVWHLPIFFIKGTYQQSLGVGSFGFLLFFAGLIAFAVAMTKIYEITQRSILAAILMHFGLNFMGNFAPLGDQAELIRVILWWILAFGFAFTWKRKAKA